jgi:glycosyltransferase involved in cell wall biosynthesis
MRIFIGLNEIAGYYSGLKKGFDEINVKASFVTVKDHRFKYHANETSNFLIKIIKRANKRTSTATPSRLQRLWRALLNKLLLFPLFIWALLKHDVFIFGQMSTFYNYKELPILKFFGKKIIHVFHGGDTRPPYICGSFVLTFNDWTIEKWIEYTRQRKNAIKKIERYADVLIGDLAFAQLAEKPFISYLCVGIPLAPHEIQFKADANDRHVTRIIHCPSDLAVKGTDRIRQAIVNLQTNGYQIEFVEISGKPNQVVLEEILKSDFVIDQLYSDTPMASVATEAAFLGKPAIVGSYAPEMITQALGAQATPPSLFCHPDDIEKAIKVLICDKEFRMDLGQRAKQYVEENWISRKVAERYLQIIAGEVPQGWIFDPRTSRHVHGCGLSEEKAKEMVRNIIEQGGREALQLSDKPELEAIFVEFANS